MWDQSAISDKMVAAKFLKISEKQSVNALLERPAC